MIKNRVAILKLVTSYYPAFMRDQYCSFKEERSTLWDKFDPARAAFDLSRTSRMIQGETCEGPGEEEIKGRGIPLLGRMEKLT